MGYRSFQAKVTIVMRILIGPNVSVYQNLTQNNQSEYTS